VVGHIGSSGVITPLRWPGAPALALGTAT
jgi:hypothetical protein